MVRRRRIQHGEEEEEDTERGGQSVADCRKRLLALLSSKVISLVEQ